MVEMPKNVTTRVLQKEEEWDGIREDWKALYASSP
jgi:hypothetical protein